MLEASRRNALLLFEGAREGLRVLAANRVGHRRTRRGVFVHIELRAAKGAFHMALLPGFVPRKGLLLLEASRRNALLLFEGAREGLRVLAANR
ncbi:MAG: hypothetical protein LBU47_02990, partial [Christensenellaceae bacterium]|nr:hypothetical protein [Christensenellaceae bacterium]